jgi:diadenosine tetraphosphate (Ap4A) HIT family hydrolase
MPSIGALTAGHVLVCPKEHARSIAAASSQAASDVEAIAEKCREELRQSRRLPVHAFEHGSSATGERVACSVEHAHLHLVPADVEIRPQLHSLAEWHSLEPSTEAIRLMAEGREYLAYEAPDGERLLAVTDSGFPSQLLRQVLAAALGKPTKWNWREHPARFEIDETIALFQSPKLAVVGA